MTARARVSTVAGLLAVGLALGQATAGPALERREPQQVPVAASTAVCPDVRQEGDRGGTAVTAAGASPERAGPPREQAPVDAGPLAAQASGAFVVGAAAGGLVVEQTTRATTGSRRGLASVTCPAPSTAAWFVGGGTVVGSFTELVLVNAGDVPALVDVRVWTSAGPVDPRPGRGLAVPGRTRAVVPLDQLAPDRDLLAVHVQTSRGQVAPALRVVRSDGRTTLGTDWVPPTTAPARDVVVPGLPQGPGRRTALLTNPGSTDAVAALALTTADGQVALDPVPVAAGTSVGVDLSAQLAGTPAALTVRSDGPPLLAGAVVVDRQDGPVREIAYAAGTFAFGGTALLADVRLSPPTEVTLLLSAVEGDAVVDLVPLAAPGTLPAPQRVEVPAATTAAVRLSRFLPPGSAGSLTVEVRPVSGEVHAARYVRERGADGPLTTLLPVVPPTRTLPRPVVVADPGAGR